jgi:DNA polymerase I-like protein with 3'-5' exonuclease and polymerase domains
MNSDILSIDAETDGFHHIRNKLGYVQMTNDGENAYFFPWNILKNHINQFNEVLRTSKQIVGANLKFDWKFFWQNGLDRSIDYTDDIVLLSQALNSNRPKGLKPLAIFYDGKFTGYDLELDEAKKRFRVDNYLQIPRRILKKYASLDVIVAWRVYHALMDHCRWIDKHFPNEKVPEWTIERWYKEVMIPNAIVVTHVEFEGVYLSKDQFEQSELAINTKIKELKEILAKEWNIDPDFEFESTQKLGRLFKQMGWPEIEKSKSGDYKTSDAILTEYERLNLPGIKTLKELRSYNVAKGTFIEGWGNFLIKHPDGTYRVHPNCNTFGTESFRHAMKDPNFQQLPNNSIISPFIKKLFVTPPKISNEEMIKVTQGNQTFFGKASDKIFTDRGLVRFDELQESDELI